MPIDKVLDLDIVRENTIRVVMYLRPEIYANSEVVTGAVHYDSVRRKYQTDVNPYRRINGPLSDYGEELEPPIQDEYNEWIEDCVFLIQEAGFTILQRHRIDDSKKSEYIIVFGIRDTPCGSIIYDLRLSDHPLDATFPEELKEEVLEKLRIEHILDESATKAGINFRVEKVTVGSVKNDTWSRAFDRLGNILDKMRRTIRKRLNSQRTNEE